MGKAEKFCVVPDNTIAFNVLLGRDFLNQFRGRLVFDQVEFFFKTEDNDNQL